jgi:hypothetical protein
MNNVSNFQRVWHCGVQWGCQFGTSRHTIQISDLWCLLHRSAYRLSRIGLIVTVSRLSLRVFIALFVQNLLWLPTKIAINSHYILDFMVRMGVVLACTCKANTHNMVSILTWFWPMVLVISLLMNWTLAGNILDSWACVSCAYHQVISNIWHCHFGIPQGKLVDKWVHLTQNHDTQCYHQLMHILNLSRQQIVSWIVLRIFLPR